MFGETFQYQPKRASKLKRRLEKHGAKENTIGAKVGDVAELIVRVLGLGVSSGFTNHESQQPPERLGAEPERKEEIGSVTVVWQKFRLLEAGIIHQRINASERLGVIPGPIIEHFIVCE